MINVEKILSYENEILPDVAPSLEDQDIQQLVDWLNEKDDNLRYKSFLLLQSRSQIYNDVYDYWDVFVSKFDHVNSYQRSLGLMLVAENTRWDEAGKLDQCWQRYLDFCDDEKPVTVRQCIQNLAKIVPYKKHCYDDIVKRLMNIDIMQRKETQRKLLLIDIITILKMIERVEKREDIQKYIQNAMTGGILDVKSK
ncbi:MAG: hypothetical protein LWX83_09395, partial [Anaerolineae bacterium]|nr:hypothetical protein [Anaerolineae bacterium]